MLDEFLEALGERSEPDQREIIFLLIRYFKQARYLEKLGKNFFDDILGYAPSLSVIDFLKYAIYSIESFTGSPAFKYTDPQSESVLIFLTTLEDDLSKETSESASIGAARFLEEYAVDRDGNRTSQDELTLQRS